MTAPVKPQLRQITSCRARAGQHARPSHKHCKVCANHNLKQQGDGAGETSRTTNYDLQGEGCSCTFVHFTSLFLQFPRHVHDIYTDSYILLHTLTYIMHAIRTCNTFKRAGCVSPHAHVYRAVLPKCFIKERPPSCHSLPHHQSVRLPQVHRNNHHRSNNRAYNRHV